jgi:hypothetical protein
MSLSDVQEFIAHNRRKILIALLLVIIISLAAGFIWREVVTEVPEEEKIPSFTLSQVPGRVLGVIDFSKLSATDFPPSSTVYRIEQLSLTFTQADAVGWARRFGSLSSSGKFETPLGVIYVFTKKGEELTITSNPRALHYTRESGGGAVALADSATVIGRAKEFLAAKKLPDIGSFYPTVKYLSAIGERTAETTAAKASFAEVNFSWLVNGLDLLGESSTDSAVRLIFDRAGRVVYLSYQFLDYSFSADKNLPLMSFEQAKDDLATEPQIVSIRPTGEVEEWTLSESTNLSEFTPESARLVYVRLAESDLLYPVYLFEGSGSTGGISVRAAAYVLAVPGQYTK